MSSAASQQDASADVPELIEVDLRDPMLAAFLAWLMPGAGHIYQGRIGKGLLFFVCIVGTFVYGLYLGGGRVVYASWRPEDRNLAYLCQIGVGLPALPALVQAQRVRSGRQPLWPGIMAPPSSPAELAAWHERLHRYFDLGKIYTMIAGLLNVLAIYDAWAGPLLIVAPTKRRKKSHDAEAPGNEAAPEATATADSKQDPSKGTS